MKDTERGDSSGMGELCRGNPRILPPPLNSISLPEKLETQRLKFTDVVGYLNKPHGKFFPKGKKETVNEAKLSLNCFFKYRSPYQFFFK